MIILHLASLKWKDIYQVSNTIKMLRSPKKFSSTWAHLFNGGSLIPLPTVALFESWRLTALFSFFGKHCHFIQIKLHLQSFLIRRVKIFILLPAVVCSTRAILIILKTDGIFYYWSWSVTYYIENINMIVSVVVGIYQGKFACSINSRAYLQPPKINAFTDSQASGNEPSWILLSWNWKSR